MFSSSACSTTYLDTIREVSCAGRFKGFKVYYFTLGAGKRDRISEVSFMYSREISDVVFFIQV